MKPGQEFYEVTCLISRKDLDDKVKKLKEEIASKSGIVFEALENNGLKVYEVSVHSASVSITPKHITLDVSGNGESTTRKGFKRHELEVEE